MAGLEGKTLNHYELRKLVGKGGMADVYEAMDLANQRIVAVKVFKREDEEMLQRFIREARLMSSLHNPHLVPVIDSGAGQVDGVTQYYIVMPFLPGGTLRSRIRRRGGLPLEEVCRDLRDIASALDYIHSLDIIHRDIKASNVLIGADGRCYLSDFGIARRSADATQLTSTGNILGTVDYVAPELFETNRKADALSDLYSLGVLLYEMVTGQLPFTAENQIALVTMHMNNRPPAPRTIAPHVPAQVERVMLKALEKKPEQRYGSATELANAFCRAVANNKNGAKSAAAGDALVLPPLGSLQAASARGQQEAQDARAASAYNYPTVAGTEQFPVGAGGTGAATPEPVAGGPGFRSTSAAPTRRPAARKTRRSRSRRNNRWMIGIIMGIVFLLVVVSLAFLALHFSPSPSPSVIATQTASSSSTGTASAITPTPTPNLTATAQAQAAMTATAQAQATQTAIARATATAQAQASATAGVIQTATAGTPDYHDPLNDANNQDTQNAGWSGLNGNDNHCQFQSDGYHVTESVSVHGCGEQTTYDNATITVNMNILSGDSGGLFFRTNPGPVFGAYAGYLFQVNSQGQYKIWRSSNFNLGNDAQVFQDWTTSSALKTGYNVKNTIEVIMKGGTMSFYANGVYLTQVQDSTYTSGIVALGAFSSGNSTEVVYSNIKIYPIS